jgi:hypothetical protein
MPDPRVVRRDGQGAHPTAAAEFFRRRPRHPREPARAKTVREHIVPRGVVSSAGSVSTSDGFFLSVGGGQF